MSITVSTDFYDVMFGKENVNADLSIVEEKTFHNVRNILTNAKKLNKAIPPLPDILINLLDMLKDPNSEFLQYVALIKKDPGLASAVLKVANSAKYARREQEIVSVHKAVNVLGTAGITKIALSVLMEALVSVSPAYHKKFGLQIWKHSQQCAVMCELLAEDEGENGVDAHFLGLIHDIGKVVIYNCLCDALKAISPGESPGSQIFKELMSEMSLDISYHIAKEWGIPEIYCQALLQQRITPSSPLAKLLYKANVLSEAYLLLEADILDKDELNDLLSKEAVDMRLWQEFLEITSK
ncbi:HDOD domain-containing protein [Thalassomonas actiniarum]|uniref:HDOD domain-containing protein n=1 Tax=Thalassomonas actiniarum TaxID=485447 RepID=A0AAF0C4P2_9GAMM|nr:HDOD domain-containing protein [Thalassomonas actiniarum]WDE02502.1 HDOD domain-containing protein [Thalassomonas actiniarum]